MVNASANWRLEDPACTVVPKSETEVKEPGSSGRKNVGHGIRTPRCAGLVAGDNVRRKNHWRSFVHSWLESRRDSNHRQFQRDQARSRSG